MLFTNAILTVKLKKTKSSIHNALKTVSQRQRILSTAVSLIVEWKATSKNTVMPKLLTNLKSVSMIAPVMTSVQHVATTAQIIVLIDLSIVGPSG